MWFSSELNPKPSHPPWFGIQNWKGCFITEHCKAQLMNYLTNYTAFSYLNIQELGY